MMADDVEWDKSDEKKILALKPSVLTDKWEGEDEDEVKDNWDDEDEVEEVKTQETQNGQVNQQAGRKKKLTKKEERALRLKAE